MSLNKYNKYSTKSIILFLIVTCLFTLYNYYEDEINIWLLKITGASATDVLSIPDFSGNDYIIINDNEPEFTNAQINTTSYESYGNLDVLGRCTTAFANIGVDLMPTEERKDISAVDPTGYQVVKYDIIDGEYLYNRCHLIGFQLTGENANENNLITCTHYMNVDIMLDFENEIADYITTTNNNVLYRVTPLVDGTNLVATGIQMEAY